MSAPEPTALEDLPLGVLQEIDRRCEQFEAAWRAGQAPAAEEHLGGLAAAGRRPLLKELLGLELVYRRKRGEVPAREDFLRRFREDADLVNALWRETDTTAGTRERTAPPDGEAVAAP
jgi:serine/threonine-protein kinase